MPLPPEQHAVHADILVIGTEMRKAASVPRKPSDAHDPLGSETAARSSVAGPRACDPALISPAGPLHRDQQVESSPENPGRQIRPSRARFVRPPALCCTPRRPRSHSASCFIGRTMMHPVHGIKRFASLIRTKPRLWWYDLAQRCSSAAAPKGCAHVAGLNPFLRSHMRRKSPPRQAGLQSSWNWHPTHRSDRSFTSS